jgi:hypothetical protein
VLPRTAHRVNNDEEEKAKPITEAFPKVRIVIGGLDDSKVLEDEAAKADVVIRRSLIASAGHAADADDSQIPQMRLTTKAPQKPLQRVSHLAIPKRNLDSGCIRVARVSCVGKPCATTTSWANGLNGSITIGLPCKT